MTVQIGNIVLDDDLQLYGIETGKDIDVEQIGVMDGSSVFQTMSFGGGRSLALTASQDGDTAVGVFFRYQLMALKELAKAGQVVSLIHHLGTFSVLILSTEDVTPVIVYADPGDDDRFVGSIQMIEV